MVTQVISNITLSKVGEDISRDNIDNTWKSKKIENKLRKLAFCVADLEHLIKSSINRSHLGGANRFFFSVPWLPVAILWFRGQACRILEPFPCF